MRVCTAGPKVQAAIAFVEGSASKDAWAAIGDLRDADDIMSNKAGTIIRRHVGGGRQAGRQAGDSQPGVVWRVTGAGIRQ